MPSVLNDADVRDRIRHYVQARFLGTRAKVTLGDEDRLMRRGIVDSLGAVELMSFLEAEFKVDIRGDEVTEENLGSVAALTRFVIGKRARAQTA